MLKLPGLIDPHVHLRTPGQEHKEDFISGTSAALAGGYTTIIDMPNNTIPITTLNLLKEKQTIAKDTILCDVGFHFGSLGNNLNEFQEIQRAVLGLKIYLSHTTGGFIVDSTVFQKICETWPIGLPILLHAEESSITQAIEIAHSAHQKIHIVHVSSQKELETVLTAKAKGYDISCGVTPHHLFLTEEDGKKLGPFGQMKPSLKSQKDVDFLWQHLDQIDLVESDHAPHSKEEKQGQNIPFGVTGLETTLSLLLSAVKEGKLVMQDVIRLCHDGPANIFSIQQDEQTYIEVDENETWVVDENKLFTKAKSSPWNGKSLTGKVKKVYIRGINAYDNGKILVKPGFGKILKSIV